MFVVFEEAEVAVEAVPKDATLEEQQFQKRTTVHACQWAVPAAVG